MKRNAKKWAVLAAAVGGLGFVIGGSVVKADIIYQDNFDGTGGLVSGRPVTVASGLDGGTASTTWTSDAVVGAPNPDALWTASGGTYSGTGTTSATIGTFSTGADSNLITNAYLPFTPQAGLIYDLHLAIDSSNTGASGNWLGTAFTQAGLNGHSAGGPSSALSNDNPYGLLISKGSGAVQMFGGLGTANQQNSTFAGVTAGQYNTFDTILNTQGTQWTMSWMVNGTLLPQTFTYTTNPAIGDVVFGTNKLTGAVSDFSLTTIPEPARRCASTRVK